MGISCVFDEANRMKPEVIDYLTKSPKFVRNLKDQYLLFTFNPGYMGRNNWPSSARLYLTSEMTIPPFDEICSGMLAIYGAKNFKNIG